MTVFHYYARYLEHPSGVTDSLNHWVEELTKAGISTTIVANATGADTNEFADRSVLKRIRHLGRSRATWIPLGLGRLLRKGDVLVLHEGWVVSNIIAAFVARLRSVPYIVVPHGVYEKQLVDESRDVVGVRAALERSVLLHAAAIHIFYEGERGTINAFLGASKPKRYIVVPNGAPETKHQQEWQGGGDYFLWIGRYDPYHKGLDLLLRYWAGLGGGRPRLVLAGPDFRGGRATVGALVRELGLENSVELKTRVSGAEKAELMAKCSAYIHPSRWESCSIMLLEMLSIGAPSLISGSIYAAQELEPHGVLHSEDFTRVSTDSNALSLISENADVGRTAKLWAKSIGGWNAVGPRYAHEISSIASGR